MTSMPWETVQNHPVCFWKNLWVDIFLGVKLEHVLGIKLNTRIDIFDMILEKAIWIINDIVGWNFQFQVQCF